MYKIQARCGTRHDTSSVRGIKFIAMAKSNELGFLTQNVVRVSSRLADIVYLNDYNATKINHCSSSPRVWAKYLSPIDLCSIEQ